MSDKNTFQYKELYKKLSHLVPDFDKLKVGDRISYKSASNDKDLVLDVLYVNSNITTIALTHPKPTMEGMSVDPSMNIFIEKNKKHAEALTFDDGKRYKEVYYDDGFVDKELSKQLNDHLNTWLNDLKKCGYKPISPDDTSLRRSV